MDNRGRIVKDRATGQPKLNCRNWECGVLVPVTLVSAGDSEIQGGNEDGKVVQADDDKVSQESTLPSMVIFRDIVPVPMKLPAQQLGEGREPWFFMG